jgi:ACS family tartrate transporter-like MFS transporter
MEQGQPAHVQSSPLLTVSIMRMAVGVLSALLVFWTLPTAFLSGTAAAAGIAVIAAVGNLGGFVGPAFTGVMEDSTGGFEVPLTALAGLLVVGALPVFLDREEDASVTEPEFSLATDYLRRPNRSDSNQQVLG